MFIVSEKDEHSQGLAVSQNPVGHTWITDKYPCENILALCLPRVGLCTSCTRLRLLAKKIVPKDVTIIAMQS